MMRKKEINRKNRLRAKDRREKILEIKLLIEKIDSRKLSEIHLNGLVNNHENISIENFTFLCENLIIFKPI